MASGDSTPPPAENSGFQVNVDQVHTLTVASKIVNVNSSIQSAAASPSHENQGSRGSSSGSGRGSSGGSGRGSSGGSSASGSVVPSSGRENQGSSGRARRNQLYCALDTQQVNNRPCRFIQTVLSPVWVLDNDRHLTVVSQQIDVSYSLNTEAVQKLQEQNCTPESVQESLGQCLAALDWSTEAIVGQKLTAFRLTLLEEKLPRLLQAVVDIISNHSNLSKVIRLVTQAFREFGAQLRQIRLRSLVFVFQYTDEVKADEMLGSEEAQGRMVNILYQFLPEWVRMHACWEVSCCEVGDLEPSMCDVPLVTWCLPLGSQTSTYSDWETEERVGMARLAHLVEPMVDRSFERFVGKFDSILATFQNTLEQMQREVPRQDIPEEERAPQDVQQQLRLLDEERRRQASETDPFAFLPQRPSEKVRQSSSEMDHIVASPLSLPKDVSLKSPLETQTSLTDIDPERAAKKMFSETSQLSGSFWGQQATHQSIAAIAETQAAMQMSLGPLSSKDVASSGSHSLNPKEAAVQEGLVRRERCRAGSQKSGSSLPENLSELQDPQKSEKFFNRSSHWQSHPSGDNPADIELETTPECEETTVKGPRLTREADIEAIAANNKRFRTQQAEELLSWVNVKSKASESTDPEIQRMMEQMELALQDEEVASPLAKAMDTVLVLDTSDSVARRHLEEVKEAAHAFVDGIEENVETMSLEENLAVLQMGGRTWVRQHLTNDYNCVREAIDAIGSDSQLMPTGGRTPLFQALVVCLAAIEGRGGVINVAGCHRVRPRLIIFTDGRPTDEASEAGTDTQSNIDGVKYSLVQLITELASKKHRTTPLPISWVPVGDNVDRVFLNALAKLGAGQVVEKDNMEELSRYFKVQQTIGCVYKLVRKHRGAFDDEQKVLSAISALAGNLKETEKAFVLEQVMKKLAEPEEVAAGPADFHNVFEDKDLVEEGRLLPLGTRVMRGPDWKWENQDTEGPGTVLQHSKKRENMLYVMWDNGTHNQYRYGADGCYDVLPTKDYPRRVGVSEPLDIGVQVVIGDDWKGGNEDYLGPGVVIRIHRSGKVKVRWPTGHIGKYTYGPGVQEVIPFLQGPVPVPDEEMEARGGTVPASGAGRWVWLWWDSGRDCWRLYEPDIQDKLLKAYTTRTNSSCVIKRDGTHRRVIFGKNEERNQDTRTVLKVQSKVVTEQQYWEMVQKEELRDQQVPSPGPEHARASSSRVRDVNVIPWKGKGSPHPAQGKEGSDP